MYGSISDGYNELLIKGAIGVDQILKTDSTISFEGAEVNDNTGKISVRELQGKVDNQNRFILTNIPKRVYVLI